MIRNNYLTHWLNSDFISASFPNIQMNQLFFNTSSNFFNPTTIMDIFYDRTLDVLTMISIQDYLNNNTRQYILSL